LIVILARDNGEPLENNRAVLVKFYVSPQDQEIYFRMAVQLMFEPMLGRFSESVFRDSVEPKCGHKGTQAKEEFLAVKQFLIISHLH